MLFLWGLQSELFTSEEVAGCSLYYVSTFIDILISDEFEVRT